MDRQIKILANAIRNMMVVAESYPEPFNSSRVVEIGLSALVNAGLANMPANFDLEPEKTNA